MPLNVINVFYRKGNFREDPNLKISKTIISYQSYNPGPIKRMCQI
jgi:hypothetical protein